MTAVRSQYPAVLMIGQHLDDRGGIVSVERLILAADGSRVCFVASMREGPLLRRVGMGVGVLVLLPWHRLRGVRVLHLHMSERLSVWRKAVYSLVGRSLGMRVLLHAHGAEFLEWWATRGAVTKWLLRLGLGRAQVVLALGDRWRAALAEALAIAPHRIVDLPNPVILPRRLPERPDSGALSVLFLGRVGERKGAFDLLRAVALVEAQRPGSLRVHLAGDGEVARARASAAELGITHLVTIPGWVSGDQREAALAAAQVLCLPSYHEGMPMAILDGLAWGCAVVSTSVGGIPDVITNDLEGLLIPPGEVPALAQALLTLVDDRGRLARMMAAGRNRAEAFALPNYMRRLEGLWDATTSA